MKTIKGIAIASPLQAVVLGMLMMGLAGSVSAEKAELVGAQTCIACHTEQGETYKASHHGRKLPVVKDIPFEKSCETCHGPGSLHAAAGGDREDPGFRTIRKFANMSKEKQSQQCLSCHEKNREVALWDFSAHAGTGMSCTDCHGVHLEQGKKNLVKGGVLETCSACHKKQAFQSKLPHHHPMEEGKMTCASCHNPHGGEFGNMRAESTAETCFKCHADKAGPFIHEHPPVVENCTNCHDMHGSSNPKMLTSRQPFLCMRCHKFPHTEGNGVNTFFRSKKIIERGKCTACHNEIHGSDRKASFKL